MNTRNETGTIDEIEAIKRRDLPLVDDFRAIVLEGRPLIDVRAPSEFQKGAFPGAVNLPFDDVLPPDPEIISRLVKGGRPLLQCSSYDRILLVWDDGRYRVVHPPETLFVDSNLVYSAKIDRDRVMTIVYEELGNAYLKRFRFGGTILNKEYRCAGKASKILLFADDSPNEI